MSLLNPQQDIRRERLGEYYYEGTVIDNNDPKKLHRVKIRIPEIHGTSDQIPDSHLPWAIHFRPTFLGGGTDLSLSSIPRVGSKVTVQHLRGDIYQPVYMFELADNSNRLSQGEQNYPNSYVLRDSDSNYWHVDLVENKLDIKFNGNKFIEITSDRTTTVGQDDTESVGNNQTTNIGQTKTLNSTRLIINTSADIDINAAANVTIDGAQIHLNGSGGGVLTQESINPLTGTPFPDGSSTVKAGDG